jgi:hypothetical protein
MPKKKTVVDQIKDAYQVVEAAIKDTLVPIPNKAKSPHAEKIKQPKAKAVRTFEIVEAVTNSPRIITLPPKSPQKNAAAVALGRLGGLKGDKARAKGLPRKQRAKIARDAARARRKK